MAYITYLNSTPDNAKLFMIVKRKLGFGGTKFPAGHLTPFRILYFTVFSLTGFTSINTIQGLLDDPL